MSKKNWKMLQMGQERRSSSYLSPLLRVALDNLGPGYWYLFIVIIIIISIIIIIIIFIIIQTRSLIPFDKNIYIKIIFKIHIIF